MKLEVIQKNNLSLIPALPKDRRLIFQWMTQSDISTHLFGPPTFPEMEAPDWKEFLADYTPNYFSDKEPLNGRCFLIKVKNQLVGQINYNTINVITKQVEIDIWLAKQAFTRKGYGTTAILLLCDYLTQTFDCTSFMMQPSARNPNAIAAYQKIGFEKVKTPPKDYVSDYVDSIMMVKTTMNNEQ